MKRLVLLLLASIVCSEPLATDQSLEERLTKWIAELDRMIREFVSHANDYGFSAQVHVQGVIHITRTRSLSEDYKQGLQNISELLSDLYVHQTFNTRQRRKRRQALEACDTLRTFVFLARRVFKDFSAYLTSIDVTMNRITLIFSTVSHLKLPPTTKERITTLTNDHRDFVMAQIEDRDIIQEYLFSLVDIVEEFATTCGLDPTKEEAFNACFRLPNSTVIP